MTVHISKVANRHAPGVNGKPKLLIRALLFLGVSISGVQGRLTQQSREKMYRDEKEKTRGKMYRVEEEKIMSLRVAWDAVQAGGKAGVKAGSKAGLKAGFKAGKEAAANLMLRHYFPSIGAAVTDGGTPLEPAEPAAQPETSSSVVGSASASDPASQEPAEPAAQPETSSSVVGSASASDPASQEQAEAMPQSETSSSGDDGASASDSVSQASPSATSPPSFFMSGKEWLEEEKARKAQKEGWMARKAALVGVVLQTEFEQNTAVGGLSEAEINHKRHWENHKRHWENRQRNGEPLPPGHVLGLPEDSQFRRGSEAELHMLHRVM